MPYSEPTVADGKLLGQSMLDMLDLEVETAVTLQAQRKAVRA